MAESRSSPGGFRSPALPRSGILPAAVHSSHLLAERGQRIQNNAGVNSDDLGNDAHTLAHAKSIYILGCHEVINPFALHMPPMYCCKFKQPVFPEDYATVKCWTMRAAPTSIGI